VNRRGEPAKIALGLLKLTVPLPMPGAGEVAAAMLVILSAESVRPKTFDSGFLVAVRIL